MRTKTPEAFRSGRFLTQKPDSVPFRAFICIILLHILPICTQVKTLSSRQV